MEEELTCKELIEYLGKYTVVKHGNKNYRLVEHDSLVFHDQFYFWNSRNKKGNYISLLKDLYEMDNKEIAKIINEYEYKKKNGLIEIKKEEKTEERKESFKTEKIENFEKIRKYLVNERKIDLKIVKALYKNGSIFIDNKFNINFVIKDKNGEIKGSDKVGTNKKCRFRANTSEHYGFNIKNTNEKIEKIFVFESPIDLISYLEMNKGKSKIKDENIMFLSVSGVRMDILKQYVDKNIKEITICSDNDKAGENFYEEIKKNFNIKITREKSKSKDWNDDLKKPRKR